MRQWRHDRDQCRTGSPGLWSRSARRPRRPPEFLDPKVKWHGDDPSASSACQNREQALEVIGQAGSRRGVGELVDVLDSGERVVVIMRPPSLEGERAGLIANLTTFRHGKAVEMVHYPDPEEALAAAGI